MAPTAVDSAIDLKSQGCSVKIPEQVRKDSERALAQDRHTDIKSTSAPWDPLDFGMAEAEAHLRNPRTSELQHGRVGMTAVLYVSPNKPSPMQTLMLAHKRSPVESRIEFAQDVCEIHDIIANEQLDEADSVAAVVCLAKIGASGRSPGFGFEKPWIRLYDLVRSRAANYTAKGTARVLRGYARLTRCGLDMAMVPLPDLEEAVEREAPHMTSRNVAMTISAYGGFKGPEWARSGQSPSGVVPPRPVLDALEAAIRRGVTDMIPQDLSKIICSYPRFGLRPMPSTFTELEVAAERLAGEMEKPRHVSNTLYGFAVLGAPPAPATLDALDAAAERMAGDMVPQDVAHVLWSYAVFDRSPPPSVIEAAGAFANDFQAPREKDGLMQCFQAHLSEAAAGRRMDLPKELLTCAESALRQSVIDMSTTGADGYVTKSTSSRARIHREDVSGTLTRMGRQHIFDGLTEDGLFRVDCLIEDGPARQTAIMILETPNYIERVLNGGTLLRNRLLEARGFRVIGLPWYEWQSLKTEEEKEVYLLKLLGS
jgi:hypothetical protein